MKSPKLDAYSTKLYTLKIALLPPALSVLDEFINKDIKFTSESYKESAILVSVAICVFTFDVLFKFAGRCLDKYQVWRRRRHIGKEVQDLEERLLGNSDKAFAKKVRDKIKKLKNEDVDLITK